MNKPPNPSDATVALPILGQPETHQSRIRKSKMGPRRAAVLIIIHVVMIAHFIHWRLAGRTVSPVEPSESMQTLNNGAVNAGFIFFAAALLATLIFGRFFCGWACHVVALQDLCAWMLKKIGIRPAPFHSRLLMFAPLILALYMFVWPSLKRVVAPLITNFSPTLGAYLGPIARIPDEGLTNHIITEDYWATFPSVWVAIPFLLVCGFATVYFLGAKGFCTYGCPYGGFFAPLDLAAPGRIVVDHDKCDQTGHCTAVCTSNVRVHEEIREHGMVVDPGCMKCMDCISVCPNSALSFAFRAPALTKGQYKGESAKSRLDTTRTQDLILALVFLAVFLGARGQYGVIPMLMAMGIAAIGAYLAWKCIEIIKKPHARILRLQLKKSGRMTRGGFAYLLLVTILAALTVHSLVLNQFKWRGDAAFNQLLPVAERLTTTLGADTPPHDAERARDAASLYERSLSFRSGGLGLFDNDRPRLRASVLRLMAGEPDRANQLIAPLSTRQDTPVDIATYHARLLSALDRRDEAIALLRDRIDRNPSEWQARELWATMVIPSGRSGAEQVAQEAEAALKPGVIPDHKHQARARTTLTLGMAKQFVGNTRQGEALIRRAAEIDPTDQVCLEQLARMLVSTGEVHAANNAFDRAISAGAQPSRVALSQMRIGSEVYRFISKDEGVAMMEAGFLKSPNHDSVLHFADQIRSGLGVSID